MTAVLILVWGLQLISASNLCADETSEAILRMLVKKGVVTEDDVEELKAEIAREKKTEPLPAKLAEAIQPAFAKEGQLKFKGYVQGRYEWHQLDSSKDTFRLKAAYIVPYGTIVPGWDFEVEIDAADSSGKPMRNAFIEFTAFNPYTRIRFGQQKPGYSEEFWTSSTVIDTIERALPVTRLSAERDIGINAFGALFEDRVDYSIGIFNGSGINTMDNNDSKDVAGRIVFSPFKGSEGLSGGFKAGGAFWTGKQPQTEFEGTPVSGRRNRYAGLLAYQYSRLKLQSEYLFQAFDKAAGGRKKSDGWYLLGAYDLMDDYPNLQLVAKFEQYNPDIDASRDRSDIATVGINYFFNKYVKVMANYRFRYEQNEIRNDEFLTQLQAKF